MNLFFAVEIGETLYLVDQHAAHERVIFDRLKAGNGGQELLFPIRLEIPEESAPTLAANAEAMRKLGIVVEKEDSGYELASVPAGVPMPAEELAVLLMELIDRPDDFERELFASLSCRSAVMDGDIVAPEDAVSIIEGVIGLDNARCPHGRPVWVAFTKEQLAQMVGRT
jgi:DNA mismatch repair protein MutL